MCQERDPLKECIRVCMCIVDENGQYRGSYIKRDRDDIEYRTTVDSGYEDLDLRLDSNKINLYLHTDTISLGDNKSYQVIKREFLPNRPVSLVLDLQEVK